MKTRRIAEQPIAGTRSVGRAVLDAWRCMTTREVKGAFLFGVALSVYHVIVYSYGMLQRPFLIQPLLATILHDQLGAFTLMLGIVAADHAATRHGRRRAPYVLAVVASAVLTAPLGSLAAICLVSPQFSAKEVLGSTIYAFFEWLVLGGAATFIYTDRRRARAAAERMHAAQVERAHAAKRTLESRLQAMQARVEPQFLFNTLAQVRELYRASAALGERMLDELIAYLRAAMPRMRDTSSTLEQELELVRAYLGIVRLRLGERFTYEISSAEAGKARIPPMMLLPLVDHAIVQGFSDPRAKGTVRIREEIAQDRLSIRVSHTGTAFRPESEGQDIADIRSRLSALYGDDARLLLQQSSPEASEAVLDFRYDAAGAVA